MRILEMKTAIVTGAGSGIGKAVALLFAMEGARVVVSDIDEKGGYQTVTEIKTKKGDAVFIKADTSKPSENKKLVEQSIKLFGGLHIAVNNAGIGGPSAPVGEYSVDGWDKVISINLSGVFYGMRYQIPAMLKSGEGSIINMASILGSVGFANSAAYVASKHGVVGLTKNAAIEYAAKNIRINSIGPGFILTPLIENNMTRETIKFLETKHPMGRLGTSEEVAELALWLASSKSSFVTGSYYTIDGGYTAQ